MESPARIAACAQVRDLSDAASYVESLDSAAEVIRGGISPYFWPNGKVPIRDDWKRLAQADFENFRLKVGGLVENPLELFSGRSGEVGRGRTHHHASLHPGMERHREVGRHSHENAH